MIDNKILNNDLTEFTKSCKFTEQLKNSVFLITGTTGLIGSILTKCLLALNGNIKIIAPVRDIYKAQNMYISAADNIHFVDYDTIFNLSTNRHIDYIVHCASPTDGKYMTSNPVETYEMITGSTCSLLQYCKNFPVKSFTYISSLEFYGQYFTDELITENMLGYIDFSNPRNSYPLGKQAAEFLCMSYAKEYNLSIKIARLTQTFGAGVSNTDNRVFAQFARSVIDNTDIILHTEGNSAKPYCYTIDAVNAILHILLLGKNGEAYNVANPNTYISIKDFALFVKDNFAPNIEIIKNIPTNITYAPETKLNLDVSKLQQLGWSPQYNLKEMFEQLLSSMKNPNLQ